MNDTNTYLIQLNGQIDVDALNTKSPLEMKPIEADMGTSSFIIHTDQSGLIGILRHLHARGIVLLSVTCNLLNRELCDSHFITSKINQISD